MARHASLAKYAARTPTGAYKKSYYRTIYFHRSGLKLTPPTENISQRNGHRRKRVPKIAESFPRDGRDGNARRDACDAWPKILGGVPVFGSDQFNMYELVSILRACDRLLSSRYHAIVTTMPAGFPPPEPPRTSAYEI